MARRRRMDNFSVDTRFLDGIFHAFRRKPMIRNIHLARWLLLFSVVPLAACTVYTMTPSATVVAEGQVVEYEPPPPPPPRVEVIPPAPSSVHVWIGGSYRWSGRAYVWA